MKLKLSMPGLNKTISRMVAKNAAKQIEVRNHVIVTALNVQTKAKVNQVPHIDTGVLHGSIDMSSTFNGGVAEAIVKSDVEYAPYHEAQYPFMEPAAESEVQAFKKGLKRIIEK